MDLNLQHTLNILKGIQIMHNLTIIENTDDLVWEEIYPNVIVYRNMLKDPIKAYETLRDSESTSNGEHYFKTWDPWAHFGTYTQFKDEFECRDVEKTDMFKREKELVDEVTESYNKAISHYLKQTGVELPEGARYSGQSYCKYFNEIDTLKNNMTMQYHTDYVQSHRDMPGEKFFITCTFYLNDNYNGGDIEFYINGETVNHKPQAGDIVIFPSIAPYYHGVKTIPDGNKFFIRNFIMHDFDGEEEWLANQKRYGAYKWAKMEIERCTYEDPRSMIYLQDGKKLTYDEFVGDVSDQGTY